MSKHDRDDSTIKKPYIMNYTVSAETRFIDSLGEQMTHDQV